MKIKAILFDLDNTLIDFVKMKEQCVKKAAKAMIKNGLPLTQKDAEKEIWDIYKKYGWEYQKVFQKLLLNHMSRIDYSILAPGIVAYKNEKQNHFLPYPDVKDTLFFLKSKGYKLGILTDAPKIQAWLRLASMDLHKMFDIVLTSDDVKTKKPDPKAFKLAVKKMGSAPQEIVMIGDDLKRDILGAKKVGLKTVLAKYGLTKRSCVLKKKIADFEVLSFKEIPCALTFLESI
ncbi:MAG TPA: TIGR02253 family HAD-type hydrolase [archaeon]|nr:TIGR02253 family HAD-type hydrolase [archaeon]HRT02486.1 TIGR02253 family HAD-type hydrolase [Candidatus Diapherotrites archaeon]